MVQSYGQIPLHFERNDGQADGQVAFLARGAGYTLFLTDAGEAVLSLRRGEPAPAGNKSVPQASRGLPSTKPPAATSVLRVKVLGADLRTAAQGREDLPGKSNYFIGNDPSRWRTDVPQFARVHYDQVYPGIDLTYYGNQGQLEYDWIVAPGADPGEMRMSFEGASDLRVDDAGALVLELPGGEVIHKAPIIYQERDGGRAAINGRYVVRAKNEVGFEVGAYDQSQTLVIDPVLVYSTFVGSANAGFGIAVAADGSAYITGDVGAGVFPTLNPFQGAFAGATDVFVSKFSPTGALVYSTYLGGSSKDEARSIALDPGGSAYVAGNTLSTDFPLASPFQAVFGGGTSFGDAFAAKLSPSGSLLVYSTYLGGALEELGYAVAVDSAGSAYVGGETYSANFPILNPYQASIGPGANAGFVTKLTPSGALAFSTFIGTNGSRAVGVALDPVGNIYVAGVGTIIPINAFQSVKGSPTDAWVVKLLPTGSTAAFATYLGGSGGEDCEGIAVDAGGSAYVVGLTTSFDFPTRNAYQSTLSGGWDVFLTKLSPSGAELAYSTYLGGSGNEDLGRSAQAVAVDSSGNAYLTGWTVSQNFPIANPYQGTFQGLEDAFVTKIAPSGNSLIFSTYLGGTFRDRGHAIAVDSTGSVFVTGGSDGWSFPLVNASSATEGVFITKLQDRPRIRVEDVAVTEGDTGTSSAMFTATLSASSLQEVQVNYQTASGSASAPDDFASLTGLLTFPAGVTSQTMFVTVSGDAQPEGDEFFTVNLSSAINADIEDSTAIGAILDDDVPVPGIAMGDIVVAEGNSGTALASFPATLSSARGITVTVTYATTDVTARAGSDYTTSSGTLRFSPWTTTASITVPIIGDSEPEGREMLQVNLGVATNATVTNGAANVTINDDDSPLATSDSLVGNRQQHTATLLPGGDVLVVGDGTAEIFDRSGAWSAVGSTMVNRIRHTSLLLPSGRALTTGGWVAGDGSRFAEIYDPVARWWTVTQSLSTPRADHTTTLLPNGRVLAVGGVSVSGPVAAAELYDPGPGAWAPAGSLTTARSSHTATLLGDGRVLIVGGTGSSGPLGSMEIYNGAWSIGNPLLTPRSGHCAVLLGNGKVLAVGGAGSAGPLASAQLFDPVVGTWSSTGSLTAPRQGLACALLNTGEVLIVGGTTTGGVAVLDLELYDPSAGTWSRGGRLAIQRTSPTATVLPDGRVLIVGGNATLGHTAELFDPMVSGWTSAGGLGTARAAHTATLLPDGRVLAVGGASGAERFDSGQPTPAWSSATTPTVVRTAHTATLLQSGRVLVAGGTVAGIPVTSAELYQPIANLWSGALPLTLARAEHTATLLADGRVLAVGGRAPDGAPRYESEFYSDAAWLPGPGPNTPRYAHTATLLRSGRVLVVGGSDGTQSLRSAEVFDPDTGAWTIAAAPNARRQGHIAVLLPDGRVLIAGGLAAAGKVEIYDPDTNSWTSLPDPAIAREGATATALWSGQVLVAGGFDGTTWPARIDLFDPGTGKWVTAGLSVPGRQGHTATLLAGGQILLAGGSNGGGSLLSATLFDPGPRGARVRPSISSAPALVAYDGPALSITGTGLRGDSESGTGGASNSSVKYP